MIETEIKLPLRQGDAERIAAVLSGRGFRQAARFRQRDTYFDNAAGEIRRGGKALRVRETEDLGHGGLTATMNFKGPRMDRISMTRQELETEVGQAETGRQILAALNYAPVPPEVFKERTEYRREEITACLDRVEGLGDFLELEIMAREGEEGPALLRLEGLLGELGYGMSDTVTRSYLGMLTEKGTE